MTNNILISRETRKVLNKDSRFIGIEGENLQEVLVFNLDKELEGSAIIEIQFKDETKGFIEVEKTERGYELPVKSSLLTQEGLIKMQLRILQEGQEVFKSEIIRFDVDKAINATATIPEEYPTWIDNLESLKASLEQAESERAKTFSQMQKDVNSAISDIKDKTEEYNINAENKTTEYNENAQAKLDEYNTNAQAKLEEVNNAANSAAKVSLGKLNDKLLYDLYDTVTADDIFWKNVTVYNGSEGNYTTTAITSDYVYMKKGYTIYFYNTDIYRSRITLYDLNKAYVKNTGTYASRSSYTLDGDYYVRVGFDKVDGGDIAVSEGNTNNVIFEGYAIKKDSFIDKIICDLYKKVTADELTWKKTTIFAGNESSDDNAITSDFVFLKKGTKISFNSTEYKSRVTIYDFNKNYIKNTSTYVARDSYTLEDSCYVRIGLNKTGITVAEGNSANVSFEGYVLNIPTPEKLEQRTIDYDLTVKNINHRGYNTIAPENTLSAYRLSKQNDFKYVECDVSFTSDEVPVLLHDSTVDRTSTGTGNINELTFEDVRSLDFGSWKSSDYAGELIPSFEEFIALCRNIGLYPYIEIKSSDTYTEAQIQTLVDIVKKYGMINKATWISFNATYLGYVKNYCSKARLGYVVNSITDTVITTANNLKNDVNEVFIDCSYSTVTEETVDKCITNNIPLEVWTVNAEANILSINPYVSGITSDSLIAGKILYENEEV